jgi:poly(3-hydroxybutyrate) depolymerase
MIAPTQTCKPSKVSAMNYVKAFAVTLALFISASAKTVSAEALPVGEGVFQVEAPRGPVPIYTYRAAAFGAESPIWIIMHGVGRSADDYFDVWRPFAEKHGALLLVPEFTSAKWPDSWRYALGNMTTSKRVNLPHRDWSITVVQKAFAQAVAMTGSRERGFYIYGHSAGGQFVHCYVMHTGGAGVKLAITANSGWYILPDGEYEFPYGLKGAPISQAMLRKAFATPMIILLGQEDTERGRNLRRVPETEVQGPHRLARGHFFYKRSANVAQRMGAAFDWRVVEVPGAGHRNDEMAPAAARLMAVGR